MAEPSTEDSVLSSASSRSGATSSWSLPTHASWLNQIEIYFSILQRKALTPADFDSREMITDRILGFQEHYQAIAKPFDWRFTPQDLLRLTARCNHSALGAAA